MSVVQDIVDKALGKTKVTFAVCTHRAFDIDAMTNAMQLYGQKKHAITWLPMKGDALIDRARSRVASWFLQNTNDDILFFVDDDGTFKTEDVIKTIEHVRDGKDICGALVMLKKPQQLRMGRIDKNILFFKDQTVTFNAQAKPVEVHMLGTGFMAIHRKVLEGVIGNGTSYPDYHPLFMPLCHPTDLKFWPLFQPFPKMVGDKWIYLSEDWAFCERARAAGFKVWLDPSIFITHHGDYGWDLADALREPKEKMDENFSITLA